MVAEYRVLGPLEVRLDGQVIAVPAGRGRLLLATLLLRANSFVSVDELIDRVWEGTPPTPDRARTTLHMVVTRLRQAMGDANCVRTLTGGYQAEVADGQLDLQRFRALTAAGELSAALDEWRGQVLENVRSEALHRDDVPLLIEEHLAVLERRIDADLKRGVTRDLVPELRSLTRQHPLRERFWCQLMLALYRSAQQAEALAAFHQVREHLADELGIDPGVELRELQQQILVADPRLRLPAERTIPRQLPMAAQHFVGRTEELCRLADVADLSATDRRAVVISAIDGIGGIGKTALAVHWAHLIADHFPDGQLYANLRGFDPTGEPVEPSTVLRGFLEACGTPPDRIPGEVAERAALFRTLVAERRILVVLDNARDSEHVRPILPANAESLVIITSRMRLAGLVARESAYTVTLGLLTDEEAFELLARRLGDDRVGAEPDAVAALIEFCGGLPLALAIVAARAVVDPDLPLDGLVEELAGEQNRLDALDTGDCSTSVRTVFSWSYQCLEPAVARMFRLLAVHPGPDISLPAAASLAGITHREARSVLARLAQLHLLTERVPGRFAFHDLVRAYADERVRAEDSPAERREATHRMLDHYLHTAAAVDRLLSPHRIPIKLGAIRDGVTPESLGDRPAGDLWFHADQAALVKIIGLAADARFDAHAWQLPWCLFSFFDRLGNWRDWLVTHHTALVAARRSEDLYGQALIHRNLGDAYCRLTAFEDARASFRDALAIFEELGDQRGQARVHAGIAWTLDEQGRNQEALVHSTESLELYRAIDNRVGMANALNQVAWHQNLLGDYGAALDACLQATALFETVEDPYGQANTWGNLGLTHHNLGDYAESVECHRRALEQYRVIGNRYETINALYQLGDTYLAMADVDGARALWNEALVMIEDDPEYPHAGRVRQRLDDLDAGLT